MYRKFYIALALSYLVRAIFGKNIYTALLTLVVGCFGLFAAIMDIKKGGW